MVSKDDFSSIGQKKATVAIAEETETMLQSEAVTVFPTLTDEGRDQQQQGAFRLVEIGNQPCDDAHLIGGGNH